MPASRTSSWSRAGTTRVISSASWATAASSASRTSTTPTRKARAGSPRRSRSRSPLPAALRAGGARDHGRQQLVPLAGRSHVRDPGRLVDGCRDDGVAASGGQPGREDGLQQDRRPDDVPAGGRCRPRTRRAGPRIAGPGMIDGVVLKVLTVHADDRGLLMEVIRDDEPVFKSVKQTTFTIALPGVIKAFHWHKRQWDVWFFSSGMAQVVLYDLREGSPTSGRTEVFYMGERRPAVLAIPPGVAHGYRVLGSAPATLFYHTTEHYDPAQPDEERIAFDDPRIGFDWRPKNR